MKRVIEYTYYSFMLGCDCCSDSTSSYNMWENGDLVAEDVVCDLYENEKELRESLAHLEPFAVSEDSRWF